MTGIYQCYCAARLATPTFWKVWTEPELETCKHYVADGMGGSMMTMPSGFINGIMTNIGAIIVSKFVPLIRFKSHHVERLTIVLCVFVISYLNMGILVLRQYPELTYVPNDFQIAWLLFWGKAITMSLFISNCMPLLGPSIKALCRRGCCCCKKSNYRPERHLNPPFAIERRYAGIINTCFLVSSYSFSLPILPFVGSVVLGLQYVVDKLLITYYYKETVEHNDLMNRTALRIIKYGIAVFYFYGGMAIAANYC